MAQAGHIPRFRSRTLSTKAIEQFRTDPARAVRRAALLARGRVHGHTGSLVSRDVKFTGAGSIQLGHRCMIAPGVRIYVAPGAHLRVGDRTRIGPRTRINVTTSVTIGARTEISWDVDILDGDFHELTYPDGSRSTPSAPIVIGSDVLIGMRAAVLKGVQIGDGAVVGACAVVSKAVPPRHVVGGNPARILGEATLTRES